MQPRSGAGCSYTFAVMCSPLEPERISRPGFIHDAFYRIRRMMIGRFVLLVTLAACTSATSPTTQTESSEVATRPTFSSGGLVYSVTDCPAAPNLISGGDEAADALPKKGQTDRGRVESLFAEAESALVGSFDIVAVTMIHRDGEVWDGPGNGVYTVEAAKDYQYELLLGPDGSCPNSPRSWNEVPLLYNRAP